MKDVLKLHQEVCPNHVESPEVKLSLDGVQECRSNSVSMDVYSVKMENCRNIYPLKIIRPINKHRIPYKPHFKKVLDDLNECQCVLNAFIGDNPKRSVIREALNHASRFACEYCIAKAAQYTERNVKLAEEKKKNELQINQFQSQIKMLQTKPVSSSNIKNRDDQIQILNDIVAELKKKNSQMNKKHSHCVWPESSSRAPRRTLEGILAIIDNIELNGWSQLTADEVQGFVGKSLLLDQVNFNFILGVTAEYMHIACLGVVKRKL